MSEKDGIKFRPKKKEAIHGLIALLAPHIPLFPQVERVKSRKGLVLEKKKVQRGFLWKEKKNVRQ